MWDIMEPGRCLADKDMVLAIARLAGRNRSFSVSAGELRSPLRGIHIGRYATIIKYKSSILVLANCFIWYITCRDRRTSL